MAEQKNAAEQKSIRKFAQGAKMVEQKNGPEQKYVRKFAHGAKMVEQKSGWSKNMKEISLTEQK